MKRKLVSTVILLSLIVGLTACGMSKKTTNMGVNAEILEINSELKGFVVKSLDDNSILGEKCYISCENPEVYYIYSDNKSGETQDLTYEDFVVGDHITVDIQSVENSYTLTSRVQLLTQRL